MTRATDLSNEARAFLDALAIGESGGADDDAAYSILFGGGHFSLSASGDLLIYEKDQHPDAFALGGWPSNFPQWSGVWIDGEPTHAAGRYQFEPATWKGLGGGSFDPVRQDHMAWQNAKECMENINAIESWLAGSDADLQWIAKRLYNQWTSLNPATFPQRYRNALAKLQA